MKMRDMKMRLFRKNIFVLVGCLGLFLSAASAPTFAAQSKTKRTSKTKESTETSNKTPVDLNSASEQELIDLPGIGPALAKRIIANRPYSSVSDLSKASVPDKTIKKITPMVTTSSSSTAAQSKTPASSKTTAASEEPSSTPAASNRAKTANTNAPPASATQAAGGGNGKVWVNTKSGVYHKEGDRWYGKTKEGKYMTEDEAIKAGYRADKEKQAKKPE
jgi:predicted flap endonuclease-1-like 5' DNA nuclease